MNKKIFIRFIFFAAILSAMFSGCTGLRKLSDGEYLYNGTDIKYDSIALLSNRNDVQRQLSDLIKSPNTKFLWMRPFLSLYNMVRKPKKEKGIRYWVKNKLGESPVKMSNLNLPQINSAMINRLNNLGHFHATSKYEVNTKRKTAGIVFQISPNQPYKIKQTNIPQGESNLIKKIGKIESETLLKPGDRYSLKVIKNERVRIDKFLKNNGYFYFSVNYLLFDADSSSGIRQINLDLKIKPDTPTISKTAFTLDKIYVFDDFSFEDYHPDTTFINNYYYISNKNTFKPNTILDAVFLRTDSLYSRQEHYNTLSHLMGLGIYKFVNARFIISDTINKKMDAGIYLTPEKKMSIGAEINAAIKSNNYAGPGLKLSLKNRNTFKGAELFSINLSGSFETQYNGEYQGETSYEIILDGTLSFPRFVPLRFNRNQSAKYVPKTTINVGGGLYSRIRYYELHSFNVTLAYSWRSSERITQQFRPIDVNFTNLVKSSDEFQDYLDDNPTIKRSFEEQFIVGSGYNITYSNLYLQNNRTNFLISQSIELSGNLMNLITTNVHGSPPTSNDQHNILDVPYSQYVRLRNEIRYFFRIGKKDQIGIRLINAAGVPYGNSSTMPYVKQFFVGGTNSIRAFRARTVGPGSYSPPDTLSNVYIDQAGDIKIETSIEYRFPIYGYLKGAVFIDAGNIWLVNEDDKRPGGKFDSKTFYKEFAVGSGFGIRLDFSFVVVRFDLAFPLRKPSLPEGERWVFNKVQLGDASWRKNNIILNIAIGLPF